MIDHTHAPGRRSWVASANGHLDFPIQNMPLGVFTPLGGRPRGGIAIGDEIFDIAGGLKLGLFDGLAARAAEKACGATLNPFFALGREARVALRHGVGDVLDADGKDRTRIEDLRAQLIHSADDCRLELPAAIGDYTDFFAGIHHATNAGKLLRPDNPLLPNYKYVPIGYHGRASSLIPSGTPVRRPSGQTRDGDADPKFGPTRALDYEMELGFFVSTGNALGEPTPIGEAKENIFGICLVNDWSARDIQAWEYQPLGPFLAKSFATSLSPWVVTMEALAPFRTGAFVRAEGDPAPLPYLFDQSDREHGGLDLWLEVSLLSVRMREAGMGPVVLGRSNFRDLYWTMAQMLTHHASNGCNLRAGDLLASGTVSGADQTARGCLLELTSRGKDPVTLPSGEQRRFLEDGDEIILRGFCEREGFRRIGLGICRGAILPASAA